MKPNVGRNGNSINLVSTFCLLMKFSDEFNCTACPACKRVDGILLCVVAQCPFKLTQEMPGDDYDGSQES